MSFRVEPASTPASVDEWSRAMAVPASQLPDLSEDQRAEVKKFSLNEEQYKRLRILVRRYASERQEQQGRRFGELIESILKPLGSSFKVSSVSRRGTPLGWRVTIQHDEGSTVEFQSTFEVVDALIAGRASAEEFASFRDQVWSELGQEPRLEMRH